MKSKMSLVVGLVIVMMLGATGFAFADGLFGPASIYADLTGKTAEEAYADKVESDSTFGELAEKAGVYEEFQAEALKAKTVLVNERIEDGTLTREQGDQVLEALASCDGERDRVLQGALGTGQGNGFGAGNGDGQGRMAGNGMMAGGGMMARNGQVE